MGWRNKERVKRTHSSFIKDSKIYKESHQKFKVVNEMLLEASIDTGMCHGVKCREMFARKSKMTKKEGWAVLEEKNECIRLSPPTPTKKKKKWDLEISWILTGR